MPGKKKKNIFITSTDGSFCVSEGIKDTWITVFVTDTPMNNRIINKISKVCNLTDIKRMFIKGDE